MPATTPPPDGGDMYNEALAAVAAGNPPDRWDPVLHEPWYPQPNDLIGGWCVMNRNYPPSELNRDADPDARIVAETVTQTVATYITVVHNVGLHLHLHTFRDDGSRLSPETTQLPAGSGGPDSRAETTTPTDSGDSL